MLFFILSTILACKPAEVKLNEDPDSGAAVVEQIPKEPLTPIGVIAAEDCQHINMGDKACNFRLTDQNGDVWSLYDYEGDIILLDFSTVWCPPCQAAGHYTQPLQDEYASDGVQIVTVIIDGPGSYIEPTPADIEIWVSDHAITSAPVLQGSRDKMFDPTGITGYAIGGWPTYLYLDRELKFYSGHSGFSEEYVRQMIDSKL